MYTACIAASAASTSAPQACGRPRQPSSPAAPAALFARAGNAASSTLARHAFRSFSAGGHRRGYVSCRGLGDSAMEGWMDLTSLVTSGGGGDSSEIGELASKIGNDVYLDMNGWHVYLKDMKFNRDLATVFYTRLVAEGYDRGMVEDICKQVPISLGGGKAKVSLFDVLPAFCIDDFDRILEDFARNL